MTAKRWRYDMEERGKNLRAYHVYYKGDYMYTIHSRGDEEHAQKQNLMTFLTQILNEEEVKQ